MLDSYGFFIVYLDMNKTLNTKQIKELNKKLALPTKRNANGRVIPTKLTEAELNFVIFVSLAKVREANGNQLGVVQKNWNKMSKSERAEQVQEQRLARGEGTTGSQPMNT
mgnify:CR=1 FL=1|tara:strand:+ start:114 stop:443 length:330 start_codon:yes stop_codon:yes gene_type:complete